MNIIKKIQHHRIYNNKNIYSFSFSNNLYFKKIIKTKLQVNVHFSKFLLINNILIKKFICNQINNKNCPGCGFTLQSKDPFSLGYIPSQLKGKNYKKENYISKNNFISLFKEELEKEEKELKELKEKEEKINIEEEKKNPLICQRCFVLKHYNKILPISIPLEIFRDKLSYLKNSTTPVLILKIIDIFDFEDSFIYDLEKIIGNHHPIILIVNKIDLLPNGLSEVRVKNWIYKMLNTFGISLSQMKELVLVSALKGNGMKYVIEKLPIWSQIYNKNMDILVIGSSNSGKSTFINYIIEYFLGHKKINLTTTSAFPGTTLNIIDIPLPNGIHLYDTPGIHNPQHLTNWLTLPEINIITPKIKIKPQIHLLKEGHTLFVGGIIRLDYVNGQPVYFTLFFSKEIYIHVTKTKNADKFYQKNLTKLLQPPLSLNDRQGKPNFPYLTKQEFQFEGKTWKQAFVDLIFSGIGWISITGKGNIKINAWYLEGTKMTIRNDPLMPYETPSRFQKNISVIKHK